MVLYGYHFHLRTSNFHLHTSPQKVPPQFMIVPRGRGIGVLVGGSGRTPDHRIGDGPKDGDLVPGQQDGDTPVRHLAKHAAQELRIDRRKAPEGLVNDKAAGAASQGERDCGPSDLSSGKPDWSRVPVGIDSEPGRDFPRIG